MADLIDLSGNWDLRLVRGGELGAGNAPLAFNDEMRLPGTTSLNRKGDGNAVRETARLTDPYKFEGTAWFRRRVTLTDTEGKRFVLFLERTRRTAVYWDGKKIGQRESLIAPHVYDLTGAACDGEHELVIAVCNIGYKTKGGHLTSPDTQTNWCGVTGKMELRIFYPEQIDGVRIFPDAEGRCVRVAGTVLNCRNGAIACAFTDADGEPFGEEKTFPVENGAFDFTYRLSASPALWSDETPSLYRLYLRTETDRFSCTFGFRKLLAEGRYLYLNGRRIFLRGKHDGMVFPLTGCAPTDAESWKKVMGIAKQYGINHYRFHTCCPPEAAFEAADQLGILLQPELPFWGTLRDPEDPQYNAEEQEFLREEGFRLLDVFGNHPSFCLLSLGNELWGSAQQMNALIEGYRKHDPRRLYTEGSNNCQFSPRIAAQDDVFIGVRFGERRLLRGSYAMCDAPQGHVQTEKPSTVHTYSKAILPSVDEIEPDGNKGGQKQIQYETGVKTVEVTAASAPLIPQIPVISHEVGQYVVFPDREELQKYTGVLKPYNLKAAFERLDKAGLSSFARDFFFCSGKLAVACYKEDVEAALRTEELSGFQLLDLQDFPGQGTALVGILDAFMESKGLIAPEQWRQFCSDTVLLASFEDYCCVGGTVFTAAAELVTFSSAEPGGKTALWSLTGAGWEVKGGFAVPEAGNHRKLGKIECLLPQVSRPEKMRLRLSLPQTGAANEYDLTLFPSPTAENRPVLRVFRELNGEAEALLDAGKNVLLIPRLDETDSVEGTYCTDFWCYPMFRHISERMKKPLPVGTCGLVIDTSHPALAEFAGEKWTTPQWWQILQASRLPIVRSGEPTRGST